MQIVFRVGVLALGLAVAPSVSAQPSSQPDVQPTSPGFQAAPAPTGLPVRIVEEPAETEEEKRRIEEAIQREIDDLRAQQSMARSTDEITIWTRLQILLTLLGTGALLYSLHLNRIATGAATLAATAARDAISVDRAWVLLLSHGLHSAIDSPSGDGQSPVGYGVALNWKNFGRSPALKVRSYVNAKIVDDLISTPEFEIPRDESGERGTAIGPDFTFNSSICWIDAAAFDAVRRHERRLFVYGQIEYEDMFHPGITRRSEVCLQVAIESQIGDDQIVRPSLVLTPRGPQNSAC